MLENRVHPHRMHAAPACAGLVVATNDLVRRARLWRLISPVDTASRGMTQPSEIPYVQAVYARKLCRLLKNARPVRPGVGACGYKLVRTHIDNTRSWCDHRLCFRQSGQI